MPSDPTVHVIIPALDEETTLPFVLDALAALGGVRVIVVDNGSHDRTADVARARDVTVVREPRRGYGHACLAGLNVLAHAPDRDIVAFLDADGSDDVRLLRALTEPIMRGACDLVLTDRTGGLAQAGALSPVQRSGNRLTCALIHWRWDHRFADLGPFRAIGLGALRRLGLRDGGGGWTVAMQIRAVRHGLRILEIPAAYRRRIGGASKISGSVRGSMRAGAAILVTVLREALTPDRRHARRRRPPAEAGRLP